MLANVRYWLTVAPHVRAQLRRCELRAHAIPDRGLRALALGKLGAARGYTEAAATLATLAPRTRRRDVLTAIVALEVLYDYLDAVSEQPSLDQLRNGRQLHLALTDAVALGVEPTGHYYRHYPGPEDGGYLAELVATARCALARLPSIRASAKALESSAARSAEAQVRAHAAPSLGSEQVLEWAKREMAGTALSWRGFLPAAASSVVALHAIVATASDPATTPERAAETEALYLSIGALATMLDSLIDYEDDARSGHLGVGYMQYYDDREQLLEEILDAVARAKSGAVSIANGGHHLMTLVGVVAYFISDPRARGDFARPVARRLRRELRPLIAPTLAVLRIWRLAGGRVRPWQDAPTRTVEPARPGRGRPCAASAPAG